MNKTAQLIQRVQAMREGGHVMRAHTMPYHGEYTVASHSWQIVTLLLLLHPKPSLQLLRAAHFHDVPERWTGDSPATAKWTFPGLKEALDGAEEHVAQRFGLDLELNEEDHAWLKAVDILELYMWTLDQEALGNRHVASIERNCLRWFDENARYLPGPVVEFLQEYRWSRTDESGKWMMEHST